MHGPFDITGKTALITGGAQGLGRMIAEGLIAAGARVIITSRKAESAQRTAAELSPRGECIALAADLSTPDAAAALAVEVRARAGELHVLVNNAGKTWGGSLDTFPDKAWPGVMAVNVQTPFTLVRELLPELTAAGRPGDPARILNIGSAAGVAVERGLNAFSYSASKAAIHHLSRLLAAELAERNIAVNTVIPGYFPTKMTAHISDDQERLDELVHRVPMGRMGEAADIGALCVFLASRGSAYITGAEIPLDGGLTGCR